MRAIVLLLFSTLTIFHLIMIAWIVRAWKRRQIEWPRRKLVRFVSFQIFYLILDVAVLVFAATW